MAAEQQPIQPGPGVPGSVVSSIWSGVTTATNTFPVSFELVLTEDLPNGPYGTMSGMGGGKLFVAPGSTYTDVAGALQASWIKSRGSMMNMQVYEAASYAGVDLSGVDASNHSENWTVYSMEFQGGAVNKEGPAVAGMHNSQLLISQKVAVGGECCCVIA